MFLNTLNEILSILLIGSGLVFLFWLRGRIAGYMAANNLANANQVKILQSIEISTEEIKTTKNEISVLVKNVIDSNIQLREFLQEQQITIHTNTKDIEHVDRKVGRLAKRVNIDPDELCDCPKTEK